MHTALLLIALGFGYKIYAEASVDKKKSLKRLGRIVGVSIMVIALLGTGCKAYHRISKPLACGASNCSMADDCGRRDHCGDKKSMCPLMKGKFFQHKGDKYRAMKEMPYGHGPSGGEDFRSDH